jgi:hypothetical protein
MTNGIQKDLHPLLKIAEWLGIIVAAITILMAVWLLLPIDHAAPFNLLVFQAVQAVCTFIVPAWMVARLWSAQPESFLHLKPLEQTDRTLLLISIATMICALPLINCLAYYNSKITLPASLHGLELRMMALEERAAAMLKAFMSIGDGSLIFLLINLLVLAVLPAIGEEMTFRGVLQSLLSAKRSNSDSGQQSAISNQQSAISNQQSHIVVWLTAFIFSFIHFQFYGFIPRLLIGALLGYALVWSGNLIYSITMHATNNMMAVLLFYIATFVLHLPEGQLDYLGTGDTWWLTAVSLPLTGVCILLFYRRARQLSADKQM